MEALWAFVIVGGPILLLIGIIYGTIQYNRRRRDLDPASDRAAHNLRREIQKEEQGQA
jgi:hypothetical protein